MAESAIAGPVLVTGAYGLIGHSVVLALQKFGVQTVPTDILSAPPRDAEFPADRLDVAGADALARYMERNAIRSIVHAAGISGPAVARGEPHRTFGVNVCGTLDLFEAARVSDVERIVLLSSASVYGAVAVDPVSEDTPLGARDVYGASKIGGELVAGIYAAEHELESVILRPGWVYGLRRRTPCVIRSMIVDALNGRPTHLDYGLGWSRQFVWVEDVASAVCAALRTEGVSGMAFNLTDGVPTPFETVATIVRELIPEAQISLKAGPPPDDALTGRLDIGSAARFLGWSPQATILAGITEYAEGLERAAN